MNLHCDFGNTGLRVPKVVFGATALGNMFVAMSDTAKADLIREWFRCMPKPVAIDSAGKYGAGMSLEVIRRELLALEIDPADVIISNKLAWRRTPLTTPEPTFELGIWKDIHHDAVQDISYEGILRCHEDGCKMLGEYPPQLVSVHDPDEYLDAATDLDDRKQRLTDIVGAYKALEELRDAGQVAAVGLGAKNWQTIRELDDHCQLDWVMMANSFTIMNHPPELVQLIQSLASRKVAVINSAVMQGGFLVGSDFYNYRPIDPSDPVDASRLLWRQRFTELCAEHDQKPFNVAVAFGVSHPGITSVALSTSRPERVEAMVTAATEKMPAEIWEAMVKEKLIDHDYASANLLMT
ncbi:MAG: aldo/keto reductase [Rubripirellula sp.]